MAHYRPLALGLFSAVTATFLCLPFAARRLAMAAVLRRFRVVREAMEAMLAAERITILKTMRSTPGRALL